MHPLVRRSSVALSVAAVVLGGFAAGRLTGLGAAQPTPERGAPRVTPAASVRTLGCDPLLARYQRMGVAQVTPWGWQQFNVYAALDAAAAPIKGYQAVSSSTGTNVQEAGVDEPDVVKTDGTLAVQWHDDHVLVWTLGTGRPVLAGKLAVPKLMGAELLLSGSHVFVLGQRQAPHADVPRGLVDFRQSPTVLVDIAVADPAHPVVLRSHRYAADLVSARLTGTTVRLVLSRHLPALRFTVPTKHRTARESLRHNRALVRGTTLRDWLGSADCTRIAVPAGRAARGAGLGTMEIVGFDAGSSGQQSTSGLATSSTLAYQSVDHLYLATTNGGFCCTPFAIPAAGPMRLAPRVGTTTLHEFDLSGPAATYAASGTVHGVLQDRWSMDEYDGVLRLALGPWGPSQQGNSIVTLQRSGDRLTLLGRLDHLGRNESLSAVRWFDGLAVLVTARQVDPFFTLDLTDPAQPRLLGALRLPGWSSYLHPLGPNRILGLGQTQHGAAKVALFGMHRLTHPRLVDTVTYGRDSSPLAAGDPRQFTWLPEQRTAITVIEQYRRRETGIVSVVRLVDGRIQRHDLVLRSHDYDTIQAVRALPLPDGRVLLSTGGSLRLLPL